MTLSLRRIISSTFLLTIIVLIGTDWALAMVKPLRFFNNTGLTTINQNFLVEKLPEILQSHSDPDVLLMGSSLALFPAVRCDDQMYGIKTRYDRWYVRNHIAEYTKADKLGALISEKSNHQISITNIAVASSVISDQYLITKKYLASGKRPSLVILCLAPRDFLDNQRSTVEKTPTYQAIADLTSFNDFWESRPKFDTVIDYVLGNAWQFYRGKTDYRSFLTALVGQRSGHPINLYAALNQVPLPTVAIPGQVKLDEGVLDTQKPLYQQPPNILGDLDQYKAMYWPINHPLFITQVQYLDKLCRLLQRENISLVLVTMPLTKQNLALLPQTVVSDYEGTAKQVSVKFGVPIVQLTSSTAFTINDFEDSCHMNASGGTKLFNLVSNAICENNQLLSHLTTRKNIAGKLPFPLVN